MPDLAHYESTLEKIITEHLTDNGWLLGDKGNFDRGAGMDRVEFFNFLEATQINSLQRLIQLHGNEEKAKQKLVERLVKEIESNGIIHVLRKGITDLGVKVNLAYFIPENLLSQEGVKEYKSNRVTVTRQIKMSETNVNDSIDLTFLLNGLPVADQVYRVGDTALFVSVPKYNFFPTYVNTQFSYSIIATHSFI